MPSCNTHSFLFVTLLLSLVCAPHIASAVDCNANGVEDQIDITSPQLTFEVQETTVTGFAFVDLDGDGDDDMLSIGDQSVLVQENNGNATFAAPGSIVPVGAFNSVLRSGARPGNFRNNGAAQQEEIIPFQIIVNPGPRVASSSLSLIYEDPQGYHAAPAEITSLQGFPGSNELGLAFGQIVTGDFNGDGLTDLAFNAGTQQMTWVVVALNDGDGTRFVPIFVVPHPGIPLVGDLNNDGRPDLLVQVFNEPQPEDDGFEIYYNQGVSSFSPVIRVPATGIFGFALGKTSANGKTKLFTTQYTRYESIVQPATLVLEAFVAEPSQPLGSLSIVADLDGDGDSEILDYNYRILFSRDDRLQAGGQINHPAGDAYPLLLAQLNSDSLPDIVSSSGQIYINRSTGSAQAGTSLDLDSNLVPDECQRAARLDFTGDRVSDLTIARPALGGWYWYINDSSIFQFGLAGTQVTDALFAADYNGDGRIEPGVLRSVSGYLYWFSRLPDGTAAAVQWGLAGDVALTGHYDSDRHADRTVVRDFRGGLYWYILRSNTTPILGQPWGLRGDQPFSGDLDGDGIDELIVARRQGLYTVWYPRTVQGAPFPPQIYGLSTDILLPPNDMNGDGKDDLIVSRRVGGEVVTFIDSSSMGYSIPQIAFGLGADIPITGYFTAPGRGDVAVFRGLPALFYADFFINRPFDPERVGLQIQFGLWNDYVIASDGTAKR